ncbi:MAG: GEVED domain-containing protein [Thermosynechococcaceae cyanobacterium]
MFSRPTHPKETHSAAVRSSQQLRQKYALKANVLLATAVFTGVNVLPLTAVLAASPAPGTIIENQATGSFVNPADGSSKAIESNVVQVKVIEVAGVTVTPAGVIEAPSTVANPGPNQGNGSINASDVVYFTFQVTNVGNDPTQFFIPGAPSSITGGTQSGPIQIIAVDADGPSGPTAPTDFSTIPVTIRPEGNKTGDATVLGLPVGAISAGGTVTLRVPIKVNSALTTGNPVTVVLGDTGANDNSATTQNQPYLLSTLPSPPTGGFDLYTQDNQDTDGITGEANGAPFNGDATLHRQEASALNTVALGLISTLDYGDAPDSAIGTGPGNYQTTAADNGPVHTIDPNLYIGVVPDGDTGTLQNESADADDNDISRDEGQISFPALAQNTTSYTISNLAVTNNKNTSATLTAWIDFDQSGTFDADEVQTVAVPNTGTQTVSLTWSSLPGLTPGVTYARFRLTTQALAHSGGSTAPDQRSIGAANDGEVEDYRLVVQAASTVNTCNSPSTSIFNTSNYTLNTTLQNSTPLSFYGGTMVFNATLSGSATWTGGVQVQTDPTVGDYLFLQPTNAPDFLNTNNKATYVFSFPTAVTNFSMVGSGLNNGDGTTIIASYQGVPIQITAANFSNWNTGIVFADADGDGQIDTAVGNSSSGGTSVTTNLYDLTIPGPIDELKIISGKEASSTALNGTVTIGLRSLSYCLDPIVSNPNVLLIKRITAINGQPTNPNDGTILNTYVNGSGVEDNHPQWPNGDGNADPDLYGAITGGQVKPGDEVEYTIYFLSAGSELAKNVLFCDRIPDHQTFVSDAFNSLTAAPGGSGSEDRGINVSTNTTNLSYTNIGGDDTARFYPPESGLPPACNITIPNTQHNGAIVVNLGDLPTATAPGAPAGASGYVRFRATVNP